MKFLIVQAYWYFDTLTGEFRYRIKNPGEVLADHPDYHVVNIHVFHPLFAEVALNADLLILHFMPDAEIDHVISLRKRMGKPTLFEIPDNFLSLGPWVPPEDAHRSPYIRQQLLYYATRAEGLQFSSAGVSQTFGFLNSQSMVFENQADHFDPKKEDGPLVIGWGGSKGHEEDLARIAPVIIDFCNRHADVIFSYMGYPPIFERHFQGKLPRAQARMRAAGPIEDYFQFLSSLHIGLAPLSNTDFNRCRSDIKFVEYAAHAVVPVLSDAPPYRVHGRHGDNALLFETNEELTAILEDLVADPDKRNELARKTYRFASNRRAAVNHVGRRHTFYQRFLRHDPFAADYPDLPDCSGLIAYLRIAVDHYTDSRYEQCMENLDKVLGIHANYGLAHIWRLKCLLETEHYREALETYGNYTPPAIYSDLYYEAMAVAARELKLDGWTKIVVRIDDPVLRLELDPSTIADPLTRLRTILEHNPYHYKSLISLANLTASREERGELLDRLCFMDPDSEMFARMRTEN
ncbi:MAG: glycosyltransferase [Acidobacteriota bacterium]|nr:glycosyltransferase [Acidobacteriota bacterium]